MRFGLLNDFHPEQRAGGASRAIRLILTEAQQRYAPRQVETVFCTPGSLDETCDAYIIFLAKRFSDDELGYVQARPFVECGLDWWPDEEGQSKWRNLLYEKARLSVFVSPLHKERLCRIYGIEPSNPLVIPPPLALGPLEAVEGPSQRQGGVWAGEWHSAKGPDLAAVMARNLKLHTDMYSPSMPLDVLRNPNAFTPYSHPKGFVAEHEWYPRLAQYEKLLVTPRIPDAFGYIMLEGYALGLEVIVSGQTGVESYGRSMSDMLAACGGSAEVFWQAVEGVL